MWLHLTKALIIGGPICKIDTQTYDKQRPICKHVKIAQLDAVAHWGTTTLQFVGYGSTEKRVASGHRPRPRSANLPVVRID